MGFPRKIKFVILKRLKKIVRSTEPSQLKFQKFWFKTRWPKEVVQKVSEIERRLANAKTWEDFHNLTSELTQLNEDYKIPQLLYGNLIVDILAHPDFKSSPYLPDQVKALFKRDSTDPDKK